MNPFGSSMGGMNEGPNLLGILVNVAFGFVGGLMIFIGPKEVITYGTGLAQDIMELLGMNQQMSGFGFATAAPYIIITPITGMVVKELSAVRSLKSFAFFAAAVLTGLVIAFLTKGYFA